MNNQNVSLELAQYESIISFQQAVEKQFPIGASIPSALMKLKNLGLQCNTRQGLLKKYPNSFSVETNGARLAEGDEYYLCGLTKSEGFMEVRWSIQMWANHQSLSAIKAEYEVIR